MTEQASFNNRLQPLTIELRKAADNSVILGLDYAYGASGQNNGNVSSQGVRVGPNTVATQTYTYDDQNRLSLVSETNSVQQNWQQGYLYDRFGNRAVNSTSTYIPNSRQTVVASSLSDLGNKISATTNRIISPSGEYHYDLAGNLDHQPTKGVSSGFDQMTYDGENRQRSYATGGLTTTYYYDGDGHRVKRSDTSGATTVFVYDAAGQLVAEYGSATGSGTSYVTGDALGSTRVVTQANGSVKARYDYLPFGEEIDTAHRPAGLGYGGADATRQKFTRKERDTESGLDYFLARYYSSAQGRFTSPDEFAGGPLDVFVLGSGHKEKQALPYASATNPQSLNKYHYGLNNPLRYVDPDGHQEKESWTDKVLRYLSSVFDSKTSTHVDEDESRQKGHNLKGLDTEKMVETHFDAVATGFKINGEIVIALDPIGTSALVQGAMNKDFKEIGLAAAGIFFGSKASIEAVNILKQAGTHEVLEVSGRFGAQQIIPTRQEAEKLIAAAGGRIERIERAHTGGGHAYPHINYITAQGEKATIKVQSVGKQFFRGRRKFPR